MAMVNFGGSEWDSKGLVTSKNSTGKVFLMGCVDYPRVDGTGVSTVVFTALQAFFFYDDIDEVLWSPEEMKNGYTSGSFKGQFPVDFDDSYLPIATATYDEDDTEDYVSEPNMAMLERFGLGAEEGEDIVRRLKGLASFRVEKDIING